MRGTGKTNRSSVGSLRTVAALRWLIVVGSLLLPVGADAHPGKHSKHKRRSSFTGDIEPTVGIGMGMTNPHGPSPAAVLLEPSIGVMQRDGYRNWPVIGRGIRASGQFEYFIGDNGPEVLADRGALTVDMFFFFVGVEAGLLSERSEVNGKRDWAFGPQGSLYLTFGRALSLFVRESYLAASPNPWRTDVGVNIQLTYKEWGKLLP